MKTVIFIGTQKSGSSREAIRVADKLGYYTVLLTNNNKQISQRNEYKDVHLMKLCNIDDFDEMKEIIRILQISGLKIKVITSFIDSRCYIANKLAKEFGLNYFSIEAIYKMENKLESRKAIAESKYCPRFITIGPGIKYLENYIRDFLPAIIKSPKSTGSKDVYMVKDLYNYTKIINDINKKFPNQITLLEEYLDGPQFITEVLVINEVVHIIGIIEQEISYINNHFIVTGYYLQTEEPKYYNELYKAVCDIILLHGMKFGACHLELRYVYKEWKLIEINPRISGGGMNQLIEFGTGINLVEQTLKLLLEEDIDIKPKFRKHVYAQYTTAKEEGILEKITGIKKAREIKDILKVYIKPRKGNKITLPVSMGNRYAYVIATGQDRNEAENNAKSAIEKIKFHVIKENSEI